MPTQDVIRFPASTENQAVLAELKQHISRWAAQWNFSELPPRLQIKFSSRLNHALGRADARRWSITLSDVLLLEPNRQLLLSILCHEAAHIVAFRKHGVFISQHGPEWERLVRLAGFEPRISSRVEEVFGMEDRLRSAARKYEYWCPVCQRSDFGPSGNPRLRCRVCLEAGRDGVLVIKRLSDSAPEASRDQVPRECPAPAGCH